MKDVQIQTPRFTLRSLTDKDVTSNYCRWLNSSTDLKYIEATKTKQDKNSLQTYISARECRDDVLFLGIYADGNREHIGNIKYEPVNKDESFAIMGILIGEETWWGQGVATEVIKYSAEWLNQYCGITEIILGVEIENKAAIRAYKKTGFQEQETSRITPAPQTITMVLHLGGSSL